jgi:LacI family transcriptional regulator
VTPRGNVTMSDIAKHVGVSRTTVSLVLNNRAASVPQRTRQRVLDAARELGFRPDAGARALASRRTGLIGVVTEIVTGPFAAEIIKGVQDEAWSHGQLLLIAATESDPVEERAAIETMLDRRVEGLLYATSWHRAVKIPDIATTVPTVMINCFDEDATYDSIVPDEVEGGYLAAQRLVAAGHRRIAFINLDPTIAAAVGRREGYERALREAGISPDPALVLNGDATADSGYTCATELLDGDHPPTAIFCGNDRMAMGAYDAVREHHLRIPDDISIVGFDNQELIAGYLRPRLTTVALPLAEMGAAGLKRLRELKGDTNRERPGTQQLVTCPLVERASVGSPAHPHTTS